jgi:iron complex transport system substrate-binding protein
MALVLALTIVAAAATIAAQKSSRPSRIISLIPAMTEMLFAMGAGDQVVAVSSFDKYPPQVQHLARVGALLDPDVEKILSLKPDLVLLYGSQVDLDAQLARAGIPRFGYRHGGLADIFTTIKTLGDRVGRAAEAQALVGEIESAMNQIRARVKGRPRPRTLVVLGRETGALRGMYVSGGTGFVHDIVDVAGGENVFADVARESLQATTEMVLARRPEVIVELIAAPISPENAAARRADWKPLSAVPAVKSGRVYTIVDERTVVPGPRIAEGAKLISGALHADR